MLLDQFLQEVSGFGTVFASSLILLSTIQRHDGLLAAHPDVIDDFRGEVPSEFTAVQMRGP